MAKNLNKSELAAAFDVSMTTIANWVRRGCPVEERGSNGKSYEFILSEVIKWRQANNDSQTSTQVPNLPADISPNAIRQFSLEAVKHFLCWVTDEMGPAWSGLMREHGLKKKDILKLWKENFGLMIHYLDQWSRDDEFNKALTDSGADVDKIWNSVCLPQLRVEKTLPISELDIPLPESIKSLFDKKQKQQLEKYLQKQEGALDA